MRDAVRVDTVEHLLAALVSLGIDNVVVELNSPEVPIMDGSAAPFVYLIQEAGVRTLEAPRRFLKVHRPMSLTRGDKRIALYPSDHFKVTYSIAFDHPMLRHQSRTIRLTGESFVVQALPNGRATDTLRCIQYHHRSTLYFFAAHVFAPISRLSK